MGQVLGGLRETKERGNIEMFEHENENVCGKSHALGPVTPNDPLSDVDAYMHIH